MILAERLCKRYGPVDAVKDLDLSVRQGEILGLLGSNGAGKTTTLRMLSGYVSPSSGRVEIDGIGMDDAPLEAKQRLGYLPESAPLLPDMLVFDYLSYIAALRGLDKRRTTAALRMAAGQCRLGEVMHRTIGTLSKGYRQRVGLSAALLGNPEGLILDEPASGLDPNQIADFRRLIKGVGQEKAVILSTHILSEAEALCDRVIILHKGRTAAQGVPEILSKDGTREQSLHLRLTGGTEEAYRRNLSALPGVKLREIRLDREEKLCRIRLATEGDRRPEVYRAVKKEDWILLEMRRHKESLEAVFREITGGDEYEE